MKILAFGNSHTAKGMHKFQLHLTDQEQGSSGWLYDVISLLRSYLLEVVSGARMQ